MYKTEIIATGDGSDTLFVPELNEQYHSVYGAISESEHVFINNGYCYFHEKNGLTILEIGLGTGLNCLLTALQATAKMNLTRYFALEKYPLSGDIIQKLNYSRLTGNEGKKIFEAIHSSQWGVKIKISPWFELVKIRDDFVTSPLSDIPECDLIYFDAFAPDKQPEMWNIELFKKLFAKMGRGAALVTYCAKGAVRRNLVETGFKVERLPGPKRKREMLRGLKI
jgi:tRNA U34 5-methylaminomethyl-2-thiouridine-forming methyltransferase MnmC